MDCELESWKVDPPPVFATFDPPPPLVINLDANDSDSDSEFSGFEDDKIDWFVNCIPGFK